MTGTENLLAGLDVTTDLDRALDNALLRGAAKLLDSLTEDERVLLAALHRGVCSDRTPSLEERAAVLLRLLLVEWADTTLRVGMPGGYYQHVPDECLRLTRRGERVAKLAEAKEMQSAAYYHLGERAATEGGDGP